MIRYTAEQVETSTAFRLQNKLGYDGILAFVWENIRISNFASRFYLFINILYLTFLAGISLTGFFVHGFRSGPFFSYLVWGILAGSFAVVPVHEAFHGLAYKFTGAKRIHFGADMRQMLFYVAADRYVVGRGEFYFIALAPFIAINAITFVLAFFFTGYWHIFFVAFLLFHNLMCVGDFAMMAYFMRFPGKELYTFDDHKNRMSYIYERTGNNPEEST